MTNAPPYVVSSQVWRPTGWETYAITVAPGELRPSTPVLCALSLSKGEPMARFAQPGVMGPELVEGRLAQGFDRLSEVVIFV
jgi:hypothetical protein